jgi:hypothetical protein
MDSIGLEARAAMLRRNGEPSRAGRSDAGSTQIVNRNRLLVILKLPRKDTWDEKARGTKKPPGRKRCRDEKAAGTKKMPGRKRCRG